MYSINNQILGVEISENLSHSSFFEFIKPINDYNYVIFNFKKTKKVSLAGAISLICLSAYLVNDAKERHNINLFCEISQLNEKQMNLLMNFGFFREMVQKANLRMINNIDLSFKKELLELESKYVKHQINKTKSKEKLYNLIMPIATIPIGSEDLYETRIYTFRNSFLSFYQKLIENGILNSTAKNEEEYLDDFEEVLNAILEVIKNIYDHSKSWGVGAIHARNNHVEIVYQDIGVGIANSMRKNTSFSSLSEKEAIIHSFKDGVSSKSGNGNNMGIGFTIIRDFVKKRKGYLSISTGQYNIINDKFKQIKKVEGTQLVLFV
jgi:hypothetical protein